MTKNLLVEKEKLKCFAVALKLRNGEKVVLDVPCDLYVENIESIVFMLKREDALINLIDKITGEIVF